MDIRYCWSWLQRKGNGITLYLNNSRITKFHFWEKNLCKTRSNILSFLLILHVKVFGLTLGNGSWPHLKTKAPKIKACTVLKGKRNGGKVWFAKIFLFFRHRTILGVIAPRFKPGKPSSKSHLLGRICRSRRTKLAGNIYTFHISHIRKSYPIDINMREGFKIPMFKIPTFKIPTFQDTKIQICTCLGQY